MSNPHVLGHIEAKSSVQSESTQSIDIKASTPSSKWLEVVNDSELYDREVRTHKISSPMVYNDIAQLLSQSWTTGNGSRMLNRRSECALQSLNPFKLYEIQTFQPYLEAFFQHVNNLFYLFQEEGINESLRTVCYSESPPSQTLIELSLVITVGAKLSLIYDEGLVHACYTFARANLQELEPDKHVWTIRAMALLCFYHMNDELVTAGHFLSTYIDW